MNNEIPNDDAGIVWAWLKGDIKYIGLHYTEELKALNQQRSKRALHAKTDELLSAMMNFNPEPVDICSVVKHWMMTCSLPLDPTNLPSFDEFHERYGHFIMQHNQDIPVL